jgi:hypothetical protein
VESPGSQGRPLREAFTGIAPVTGGPFGQPALGIALSLSRSFTPALAAQMSEVTSGIALSLSRSFTPALAAQMSEVTSGIALSLSRIIAMNLSRSIAAISSDWCCALFAGIAPNGSKNIDLAAPTGLLDVLRESGSPSNEEVAAPGTETLQPDLVAFVSQHNKEFILLISLLVLIVNLLMWLDPKSATSSDVNLPVRSGTHNCPGAAGPRLPTSSPSSR